MLAVPRDIQVTVAAVATANRGIRRLNSIFSPLIVTFHFFQNFFNFADDENVEV
jgi:hypothetical protein